jgi:zinc finger protein
MAPNNNDAIKKTEPAQLSGQTCPVCAKPTLTLSESEMEIPYFGHAFLFAMDCSSCEYHKSDIESSQEKKGKVKYTLTIDSEDDLSIRIIKAADATLKIPHLVTISPGPTSNGYITNVEGVLNRIKSVIDAKAQDMDEDKEVRKKAKNQLKKIRKVIRGEESIKLILEDPNGNSAIISEKAEKK